jgi:hypothetical protein
MSECITVEQIKVKDISPKETNIEKSKRKKFDYLKIDNKMLFDLIFNSDKSKIVNDIKNIISSPNVLIKLRDILNLKNDLSKNELYKNIKEDNIDSIRNRTIAFEAIVSAFKSEQDLIDKYKLNDKQADLVRENGINKISTIGLYQAIGRQIMSSQGKRITGKKVAIEILYEQKGRMAVKEILDNTNLISLQKDANIINRNFKDSNEKIIKGKFVKGEAIYFNLPDGTTNLNLFQTLFESESESVKSDIGSLRESFIYSKQISRLILAPNFEPPLTEKPGSINKSNQDIELTKNTEDTLNVIQNSPVKIQPIFGDMFKYMKDKFNTDNDKSFYESVDSILDTLGITTSNRRNKVKYNLFGLVSDYKNIPESEVASVYGQSLSRTQSSQDLFENINDVNNKDLYFTLRAIKTGRIIIDQTELNYQTDKFMSRNILGSSKETKVKVDSEGYVTMVNYLKEETGLSIDELLNNDVNKDLDNLIDMFDNQIKNEPDTNIRGKRMLELSVQLALKDKFTFPGSSVNPFDAINYLNAISDLRNESNGFIKTRFTPAPDATASGLLLKMFQNLDNPNVVDELKNMGVFLNDTNENREQSIDDVYGILAKKLEMNKTEKKDSGFSEGLSDQDSSMRVIDSLYGKGKIYNAFRDISKLPIMTFAYGQSKKNNEKEVGKKIVEAIFSNSFKAEISSYDLKAINEIVDFINSETDEKIDYFEYKDIKDKNKFKNSKNKMENFFTEKVGVYLYTNLENTFEERLFKDNHKSINEIYSKLDEIKLKDNDYNSIRILPASSFIDVSKDGILSDDDYNKTRHLATSIEKLVETLIGDSLMIKTEQSNEISAKVTPIHMMDAGILIEALGRTIFEITGKKPDSVESLDDGFMLIHDAIHSNPNYAGMFERHYRDSIIYVSKQYDIVDVMLKEYQFAINKLPKENRSSYQSDLDSRKEINDKKILIKKENLDKINVDTNLFGSQFSKNGIRVKEENKTKNNSDKLFEIFNNDNSKNVNIKDFKNEIDSLRNDKSMINVFDNIDSFMSNVSNVKDSFIKGTDYRYITSGSNKDKIQFENTDVSPLNDGVFDTKQFLMTMAHEIEHFNTTAYLSSELIKEDTSKEVEYISKVIDRLSHGSVLVKFDKLNDVSIDRLNYILSRNSKSEQIAEFIAVMRNEPETSNDILNNIFSSNQKTTIIDYIKIIVKNIKSFIKDFTFTENDVSNLDMNKTLQSLEIVAYKGKEFRKNTSKDELNFLTSEFNDLGASFKYKEYSGVDNITDPISALENRANAFGRQFIENSLSPKIKSIAAEYGQTVDKWAESKFDIYKDAKKSISSTWDDSSFVGRMKVYLNLNPSLRRSKLNEFATKELLASQHRNTIDTKRIKKINDLFRKAKFDNKKIASLDDVFARTPLFDLSIDDTLLLDIASGKITVEDAIKNIESRIPASQLVPYRHSANSLSEIYLNGNTNKYDFESIDNRGLDRTTSNFRNLKKLIALNTLKKADLKGDILTDIYKNHNDIYNELIIASVATYHTNERLYELKGRKSDSRVYRGNLINDIYSEQKDVAPFTFEEYRDGKFSKEQGWIILREPKKDKSYGIAYRDKVDSFQGGLGTNITYAHNDVFVSKKYKFNTRDNNMISTIDTTGNTMYKIILTRKEQDTLGIIRNPADSLIRTYSHKENILETEEVRQELLSKAFRYEITDSDSISKLVDMIKDRNTDIPWALKLPSDININELPVQIRNKYQIKDKNLSSVNGFNREIDLIRKDLSDTVFGYKEISVFGNHYKMNKVAKAVKQLISLQKIHWIIVNPFKVSLDFTSGITYLMTRGVSVPKILKYGSEAIRLSHDLEKIRSELVAKKLLLASEPSNASLISEIKSIESKLQNHELSPALFNGLIQSLSTDIILKEYDTVSGLQNNIEEFINKLARERTSGELNELGSFIMKASKYGVNMESIIEIVNQKTKGVTGESFSKLITEMTTNIKTIKEEGDVAKYISQYIAAPSSEVTKFGSAMTQYADLVPRWILYKDLKEKGVSEKDAVLDALESFIDYKMNMPKEVKVLSDFTVLLFPSFWFRIQKVIYRLAKENPFSFGSTLIANEILGLKGAHIINSNIIDKFFSDRTDVLNYPELGLDTLIPVNIANVGL